MMQNVSSSLVEQHTLAERAENPRGDYVADSN